MAFISYSPGGFAESTCLYISSYHRGYHWNDGIEAGVKRGLGGACKLQSFYMDTKRNKSSEFAKSKALEAKRLIDKLKPDVVIACDDNASKYLVVPHLKGTHVPVVFCGVNWTVKPYGYPYPNVTGIIEVAPIKPLLKEAHSLQPAATRILFLSADVPTQHKEVKRLKKIAQEEGVPLQVRLVKDYSQWQQGFDEAQPTDILVLGNPAGIKQWKWRAAAEFIHQQTRSLTVSFGVAMSRHAVFSMINVPDEQGEWSAELAKQILAGQSPGDLPITANRRWQMVVNPLLARRLNIQLPERLLQNAKVMDTESR